MEAFRHLSTSRAIGMSIGPIPWQETVAYARFCGENDHASIVDMMTIIEIMDAAYLEAVAEKNKPAEKV